MPPPANRAPRGGEQQKEEECQQSHDNNLTDSYCFVLPVVRHHDLLHRHVCPGPLSGAHLNDDASQGPNACVFPDPFHLKGLGRHVVAGAHDARATVDGGLQDHGDAKVGEERRQYKT
jgi:hypothetical protein